MEKKDIVLSTRVNPNIGELLSEIVKEKKMSTSEIVRDSIFYYLMFFHREEMKDNPMIIISKSELAYLLEGSSKKRLEGLAELTYKNGIITKDYYAKLLFNMNSQFQITPRVYMSILNRIVFSKNGQRWFRTFTYQFHFDKLTIGGTHELNKNFSVFFKYFISYHFAQFDFEIISERLEENKIVLVLEKKEKIRREEPKK